MSTSTRRYRGVSAEDRRAERRARLVEAGLQLVSERGWAATTVRGVCAEAGLTERYFYESFADRDELMAAVFDHVAVAAAGAVLDAVAKAPHDERAKARAAIEAFVLLLTEDERRARAMLIESSATPALHRRRQDAIVAFATLVSEQGREFYGPNAVSAEDAMLTALALTGGMAELLVSWLDGRVEISRERLIDHCVELFVAAAGVSSSPTGGR